MHRTLLTFALVLALLACGDPEPEPFLGDDEFVRDPALDVELVSAHGDDISHADGDNCMRRHQENGPGPGRFSVAGTLYDADGAPSPDGLRRAAHRPRRRGRPRARRRGRRARQLHPPSRWPSRTPRCSLGAVATVLARTTRRSRPARAPATSATPAASACSSRRPEVRHAAVCFAMLLGACPEEQPPPEAPWEWQVRARLPEPHVPEDDPMSAAKAELGRHIFYDKRLSYNETMACATRHEQARAFSDGKATTVGSTGHALPRNASEPDQRRLPLGLHLGQPQAGHARAAGAGADVRRLPARARRSRTPTPSCAASPTTPSTRELFAAAYPR